ncbi:hypothetical protein [Zhongshania sp.]|jgi:hypothetical protein|uniref:hypothetical protein n=1 Tax=Zhongshania sp. TaxID=1971902 RepID=UPI0039E62B55
MDKSLIADMHKLPASEVWPKVFSALWPIFSPAIRKDLADAKTNERDRAIKPLDDVLAGSAWGLWAEFESSAPKTVRALKEFWLRQTTPKAILILDALSLREVPWILEGAQQRGYSIHVAGATASEIPGDTTPFAKALGFGQRTKLQNNAGKSTAFPDAFTESTDLPWQDCASLIKADSNIIFWHHWPDTRMHHLADKGDGYKILAKEAAEILTGDDFWGFVDKLATGRRLVITADHGYSNTALFPDIYPLDQKEYLKEQFKSGRNQKLKNDAVNQHWVPPLAQSLNTTHGNWNLVLGRKKWRSQGGYPSLAHGGLSLLEVAVPYIELSKTNV